MGNVFENSISGSITFDGLGTTIMPVFFQINQREYDSIYNTILNQCVQAIEVADERWETWIEQAYEVALRRYVACHSLNEDFTTNEWDISKWLVSHKTALPKRKHSDTTEAIKNAKNGPLLLLYYDEDSKDDLIKKIKKQWSKFTSSFNYKATKAELPNENETNTPGLYWLRLRNKFPELSELMLYWIAAPMSTSSIERVFSYLSFIESNYKRVKMNRETLHSELLLHVYRKRFLDILQLRFDDAEEGTGPKPIVIHT
jgi:isopentenyldiphosphate isomerase